jgi:hypothetical protein
VIRQLLRGVELEDGPAYFDRISHEAEARGSTG